MAWVILFTVVNLITFTVQGFILSHKSEGTGAVYLRRPKLTSGTCILPENTKESLYYMEGTLLHVRCNKMNFSSNTAAAYCQQGHWKPMIPRCSPTVKPSLVRNIRSVEDPHCGKIDEVPLPLVVNGREAHYGRFPWQAALYIFHADDWTFWCGGSLVSDSLVLTAAHCVWQIDEHHLQVSLGRIHREYNKQEHMTQNRDVVQILVQTTYQDQTGNYDSDLAIIVLSTPVELTSVVYPVCIDWNLQFMDTHTTDNSVGLASGWGINEFDDFSDTLHYVEMPVVNERKCITEQPRDFKKYVRYTTFCAGYRNGTGVCNGDSGGGLVFQSNGRWYVQGVVSVSPRRRGTSFCDPHFYTIFTKVGVYIRWIEKSLNSVGGAGQNEYQH